MRMSLGAIVLMFGLLLAPPVSQAANSVLERVPADALAFAVVPGLAQLDAKIERLQQELGLPIPKAFPLLEQAGNGVPGLDAQGTALVVVMPGGDAAGAPAVVALLPTTDYAPLAKALEAKEPIAGITEARLAGKPVLLAKRDRYAAVTDPKDRRALLTVLKPAANLASELQSYEAWLTENDVTVVVTRKGIEALTERGRQFLKQIEATIDQTPLPQEQKDQVRSSFQVHRLVLQGLENEIANFGVGVRLKEDGSLVVQKRARLMPQGQLAQMTAAKDGAKEQLLARLPSHPFVMAGEGAMNAKLMDVLLNFSAQVQPTQQYGLTAEQMQQIFDVTREQMKKIRRMAIMLAVGQEDQPIYSDMVALMTVDDSAQFLRDYPEQLERLQKILSDVKDSPFGPRESTALEIAGRPALKVVMGRPKSPGGPAEPMFNQMMDLMLGPGQPVTFYLAAADEHTLVAGYVTPDRIAETIKGLGSSDGLAGRKEIQPTAALMPKDATCIGYWSIPGTFQLVHRVLEPLFHGKGPAAMLPEFPETPPVGIALTQGDQELRSQVAIPQETVRGIGQYLARFRSPKPQAEKPQ